MLRVVVVWSTAPGDRAHFDRLWSHLAPLDRVCRVWHRGLVDLGKDAARRVRDEVDRAKALVLLVSADLLASEDFAACAERIERARAAREDAALIPVLVRHCHLERTPLEGVAMLPDGGPIEEMPHPDRAWATVIEEIQKRLPAEELGPEEWDDLEMGERHSPGRSRLRQVARIAKLRFPEAEVTEQRAAPPFAGLVVVTRRTEQADKLEPIGVLDGPMSEGALEVFQEEIEAPYRVDDPMIATRIVHTGDPVSADLYKKARRRGVEIETFVSYQRLIDFQRYLAWQGDHLDRNGLYPEELYVLQRGELRIRLDREESADVLTSLVRLMEDDSPRVVLVLGDFGTGKTFLLRQLARRLTEAHARRAETPAPVLVEMRALEKCVDLDKLLAQHFQRRGEHEISVSKFRYMLSEGRTALLFDGFDELAVRVTYDSVLEHLRTVLEAAEGKAKVVVTSRTAHFLSDRGTELELARKVAEREGYRLLKLHLFDERQIRAALEKRLGSAEAAEERMALLREVEDLMGLSKNPRMLGFILEIGTSDLREAKEKQGRITSAALYELLVTKWLEWEAALSTPRGSEPVLTLRDLWHVVEDLAIVAATRTEKWIRQQDIPAETWSKLEQLDPGRSLDIEMARLKVSSRSLLIRDEEGRFSFWHESILNWLVARAAARELQETGEAPLLGRIAMGDLMCDFFSAMATRTKAVEWARRTLAGGGDIAIQNANRVLARSGPDPTLESVAVVPPLALSSQDLRDQDLTRTTHLRGAVPLDLSGHDLRGQDLSGTTHLRGAILKSVNLEGANLEGADLEGANLEGANLAWVHADSVNLKGANLNGTTLTGASLLGADLRGAQFEGSDLRRARMLQARMDPSAVALFDESGAHPGRAGTRGYCPPRPGSAEPTTLGQMLLGGTPSFGNRLAISPDGSLLACGTNSGTVILWDLVRRRAVRSWPTSCGWVTAVAFSPDGRILATASHDRTVRLWDALTHAPVASLEGHLGWVMSVAFSPDGRTLASASHDKTVRLWDAVSHAPIASLRGHSGWVMSVAFSPDGRTLASASRDATVQLWDAVSHAPIASLRGHLGWVMSVAFSPDGRTLASASRDNAVRLWDAVSHSPSASLHGHSVWVTGVAFSPDGRTLASVSRDATIRLWDAVSRAPIASLQGHSGWVMSVAFSPDGRTLASASHDNTVRLWDAVSHTPIASLQGHSGWVMSVAFSPDGRTLAFASQDSSIQLWDARSQAPIAFLQGHSARVTSIAFSPDGRTLASASVDATVRLWDAHSHAPIASLEGHSARVTSIAFSPDGRTLASASHDKSIRLWSAVTHAPVTSLEGHSARVTCVAFSPDGRTLASASLDRTIRLWDAVSHAPIASVRERADGVTSIAVSPSGRILASASLDNTVQLWDADSRAPIASLQGHSDRVTSVAFSPDGRTLASACLDNTVRLWNAVSGAPVATLDGHSESVVSVAFSPDGRTLASASLDNTVRLWDVATTTCLVVLVPSEQGWAAFSPDGRYKLHGDIGGRFWHTIGLCRFEPGELDDYLDAFTEHPPRRLALDEPFY